MHLMRTSKVIWGMSFKIIIALLVLCACAYCYATGNLCIVCDGPVAEDGAQVVYRGVFHPVCAENCLKEWQQAVQENRLDPIVFKVEPRGALFQGDSKFLNTTFQKAHPLSSRWLWLGIWLLVAIVSGGWAASLAIASHRAGFFAFLLGFMLPCIGVLIIRVLPGKSGRFDLRGTKIPTTHIENFCPQCNKSCHPAAKQCLGCGASLIPKSESEVFREGA